MEIVLEEDTERQIGEYLADALSTVQFPFIEDLIGGEVKVRDILIPMCGYELRLSNGGTPLHSWRMLIGMAPRREGLPVQLDKPGRLTILIEYLREEGGQVKSLCVSTSSPDLAVAKIMAAVPPHKVLQIIHRIIQRFKEALEGEQWGSYEIPWQEATK